MIEWVPGWVRVPPERARLQLEPGRRVPGWVLVPPGRARLRLEPDGARERLRPEELEPGRRVPGWVRVPPGRRGQERQGLEVTRPGRRPGR